MLTFVMALLRFFLIGMIELSGQIDAITGNRSVNSNLWTLSFSYLFFGQIIDNITRLKRFFIVLELLLALWFFTISFMSIVDFFNGSKIEKKWHYYLLPMDFFIIGAMQLIQIIQLFNWFSKRRIGTMIGFLLAM